VIERWSELREPFFAVVHYSNLHRPRLVDPEESPFKPSADKSVRREEGRNHYKNAVYLSDRAVAKLIKHVRGTPSGARTVIVYTSDHAEAFLEHGNENDHSSTVYDEEIHVPTWIDGPEGTLSPAERASLHQKKGDYLVQYDLAATLIDLLGLWDDPGFAPFRGRFIGYPLTRPGHFEQPVPLTNVSWVWEYHLPNWGMIRGSKKVMALAEDDHYRCYDLVQDPKETTDLGEAACPELVAAAKQRFPILPRDMRSHMRSRQDIWGPWPPSPAP
jgi:arylsulfatase A-like enzyme